jgi:hypothetical protein
MPSDRVRVLMETCPSEGDWRAQAGPFRPPARLRRLVRHLVPPNNCSSLAAAAPQRPGGRSPVQPTTDPSDAVRSVLTHGYCILRDVLSPSQVQERRDHLLSICGDLRYLDPSTGRRTNPATRRFTEPCPQPGPEHLHKDHPARFPRVNVGEGQRFHNGDFTRGNGVYGDECRIGIEGYIRHDPVFGSLGCETEVVRAVVEPLLGDDFRVVYTDGFVEYPGSKALSWHSDGPHLVFAGKALDASPRITSLWMLSDFTAVNGGTWVMPRSHRQLEDHPKYTWSREQLQTFHPDAVAAEGTAGSVLLFDCRLFHTKAPNDSGSERAAVQVRYGAGWYYTRLNHSGHAEQKGPPLSQELLRQMPQGVRRRFAEY